MKYGLISDVHGNWKASFEVLELDSDVLPGRVWFYRTDYPAEKTRGRIIDAGPSCKLGDRLLWSR